MRALLVLALAALCFATPSASAGHLPDLGCPPDKPFGVGALGCCPDPPQNPLKVQEWIAWVQADGCEAP